MTRAMVDKAGRLDGRLPLSLPRLVNLPVCFRRTDRAWHVPAARSANRITLWKVKACRNPGNGWLVDRAVKAARCHTRRLAWWVRSPMVIGKRPQCSDSIPHSRVFLHSHSVLIAPCLPFLRFDPLRPGPLQFDKAAQEKSWA